VEKVREFVRQWSSDWNRRRDDANKQARNDWERTGRGVPELVHCSADGQWCQLPTCSRAIVMSSRPCVPDDPELPLPPFHHEPSPPEKWAGLSAIHDEYGTGEKINPWPVPADFHDASVQADEHFLERAKQWAAEGSCYWRLIVQARRLLEGHKPFIERWLKDVAPPPQSPPVQPAIASRATRETALRKLEPAVQKAYLAYQYAEGKAEKRLEDREAYEWLRENGIDQDKGDPRELTGYEPPDNVETFQRYLSAARKALGENKYTPRGGRKHGPSIVKGDEIEYQRGDDE
jgi:hypothetical protein